MRVCLWRAQYSHGWTDNKIKYSANWLNRRPGHIAALIWHCTYLVWQPAEKQVCCSAFTPPWASLVGGMWLGFYLFLRFCLHPRYCTELGCPLMPPCYLYPDLPKHVMRNVSRFPPHQTLRLHRMEDSPARAILHLMRGKRPLRQVLLCCCAKWGYMFFFYIKTSVLSQKLCW